MMKLLYSTLLIFISMISSLLASEFRYLVRSPKALLMGDAYTAVADDEYALFYNPAALASHKGLTLDPINPTFGLTNAYEEQERFRNFPENDTAAIADRLMGFPVYLHASAVPGIKFGQVGMNLFASSTTSFVLRNPIHPSLSVDYRLDRGFIMGYAHSIGNGANKTAGWGPQKVSKSKTSAGKRTSIGASFKSMNRQGILGEFDLFGGKLYKEITAGGGSIQEIKDSLGYATGKAYGFDVGLMQVFSTGNTTLSMGASVLDIMDTQFRKTSGTGAVPRQDMMVNAGVAFKQDFFLLDYTLSMDVHPINQYSPSHIRRLHVGADVGIPFVRVMAGFNGGYLSYGVKVKVWPFTLMAGLYSVELGNSLRQEKGSRAVIYLSLLDFSFDG